MIKFFSFLSWTCHSVLRPYLRPDDYVENVREKPGTKSLVREKPGTKSLSLETRVCTPNSPIFFFISRHQFCREGIVSSVGSQALDYGCQCGCWSIGMVYPAGTWIESVVGMKVTR